MAMSRVVGRPLDAVLKADAPLPLPRVVVILLDVCEALREAHSQGVIHRDLKPGNVLLRDGDRAVVVDFGMAKIVTGGGGTGTTALTEHNMVFGTPEYMAPEQARGDELDARCDVYATGIILYELLTGSVPFKGPTPLNVLTAHLTEPAMPPRQRAPERGISTALEAVTMHAVAKDPGDRYATAGALAMAIRSALASPDDAEGVRPASRVNVTVDTTDAHSATLPAPIPTGPPARLPRVPSVPSVQPPPPEKTSPLWIVVCVVAALAGIALGAWLSLRSGR
jgi:serine/threonine-protein kinase